MAGCRGREFSQTAVEVIGAIDGLDADVTSIEAARSRMEILPAIQESGFARGIGPGDVVAAKAVTLGGSKDGSFVIDSGLTPEDLVVVEGVSKVRPGVTVKLAPEPVTAAAPDAAPAKP